MEINVYHTSASISLFGKISDKKERYILTLETEDVAIKSEVWFTINGEQSPIVQISLKDRLKLNCVNVLVI
ncbi:hypothetical protein SDC9_138344 [bioreactor metagenome]|uniref:Uncharacterized protein n=1 Tax=bioreactor metagenome TaxID=1076179 RepID=A0A645DPG9_9ZZZZ